MAHRERDPQPWKDEIVAEVRSNREQLFAECDYDLEKLAEQLRQQERASGRSAVSHPKRLPSKESAV